MKFCMGGRGFAIAYPSKLYKRTHADNFIECITWKCKQRSKLFYICCFSFHSCQCWFIAVIEAHKVKERKRKKNNIRKPRQHHRRTHKMDVIQVNVPRIYCISHEIDFNCATSDALTQGVIVLNSVTFDLAAEWCRF